MLGKLLVIASLVAATPALADHPRREEVNARLANQNHRINAGVRDGSLTPREAHRLRREDRAVRAEERAFAATHGGHITRGEQRLLNRQENRVSHQIHRERHDAQRRY